MSEESSTKSLSSAVDSQDPKPDSPRWLHVILPAVGLAGWMIFILACVGGPSWSPDGSKILFAYLDVEKSQSVIAVYDRATHTVKPIFARFVPNGKDDDVPLAPTWQKDGKRALIALSGDNDTCSLVSISVSSTSPVEAYSVGPKLVCWDSSFLPQLDERMYFGGDDLQWINLATGETGHKSIEGGPGFISEHNGHLVYMRGASRAAPNPENKDATESGFEFGSVDIKELTLKPNFTLWKSDLGDMKLDDFFPTASWEPGGSRIVIAGPGMDGDKILFLDESKGLVKILAPELGVKDVRLGKFVWSRDGKTLYAAAASMATQEKMLDYWLAEIPIAGTPGRLTKIAIVQGELDHDTMPLILSLSLRVSLSPDGRFIAATPASLGKDDLAERDRALFLIDVQHPEHHITRIPIPGQRVPTPVATTPAAAKTVK